MAVFDVANPFWMYSMPEYELEGYWTCEIRDDDPTYSLPKVGERMPLGFDKYVQNVSIPQLSLDYENTNFGLMKFKEKSAYDDVTISFYDDIYGSCLGFFRDWLSMIYDEDKCVLQPQWRYRTKTIIVGYYRIFYTGVKPIASYKMVKCLPKSIAEISADSEGGDRKTFSVTLATQRVYTVTPKSSSLSGGDKGDLQRMFLS